MVILASKGEDCITKITIFVLLIDVEIGLSDQVLEDRWVSARFKAHKCVHDWSIRRIIKGIDVEALFVNQIMKRFEWCGVDVYACIMQRGPYRYWFRHESKEIYRRHSKCGVL